MLFCRLPWLKGKARSHDPSSDHHTYLPPTFPCRHVELLHKTHRPRDYQRPPFCSIQSLLFPRYPSNLRDNVHNRP
ncbi:hypothetical protein BDP81DRAFT_437125 [Colletotrichum phormii]|uniref:Uncharacterized protein n=1 Tax=Colletotrichum phormii TaxID=359342 RepID=A0AAJ0ECH8_9PEZI|nr:uncharacterized protein BDP81DRAFT_437125 [Colletotrichum phormii]KAK1624647.1 hypothetical protein BDP81DRAFT_437125 [Colletotrichum phormii]